jgi:hypothetical protein
VLESESSPVIVVGGGKASLFCEGEDMPVSLFRHYVTSRKVAGSSPDEVDFFNLSNPSSCTMALGSTQSLTEMSTSNLPGG